MHVGWSFLDTSQAAVRALAAYDRMQFIIDNTAADIEATRQQMSSASSPAYDGLPHEHDPKAGENRMLSGIDKLDLLEARYQNALEHMQWFQPAWERLGDDDKFVLKTFFCGDGDAVSIVSEHFCIERTSAYSRRKRAVKRLAALLYGCKS